MAYQFKQFTIWSISVLLLVQCARFSKRDMNEELIKPVPVGGYEALSARIHYPKALREQNLEGTVLIRAHVSETGTVVETAITTSLHPDLDQIVSNAVKRTSFVPATRKGEPTAVWIAIPFVFALKDWQDHESPFSSFEMVVHPDAAYKSFEVAFHGRVKSEITRPLRIECLLPINHENAWVKTESGSVIPSSLVRDDQGEWLSFEQNETRVSFGFHYRPLFDQIGAKFLYGFTMNYPLPPWTLTMIHDAKNVKLRQIPTRTSVNPDGSQRYEYDLPDLEAYELRFLEISLEN